MGTKKPYKLFRIEVREREMSQMFQKKKMFSLN